MISSSSWNSCFNIANKDLIFDTNVLQTTTELNKDETAAFDEKCELGEVFKETCQTISILVDDEDLERQEGLVNPPLTCSCHHTSATSSGSCFLCKGMYSERE